MIILENMLLAMSKREKLQYAIVEIDKGRGREEVAQELGYTTYRSLDNAFRLDGYYYDKELGNYVLQINKDKSSDVKIRTSKADDVIALFAMKKLNGKEIAEKLGFENARILALYMKSKGYVWDAERNNYVLEGSSEVKSSNDVKQHIVSDDQDCAIGNEETGDLLKYLEENELILKQLIEMAKGKCEEPKGIPRYGVPGIFITKSVHMSNQLDQMVRDFSSEKNIAQRDIFEVALIHFFQEFGYEREVKVLLERR